MGKVRLKKILKVLGFFCILILGLNLFLLFTGWYGKKVEGKNLSIFSVMSDKNSADRKKSSNVYDYFSVFNGLDMGYDISLYIEEGTVELNILEADDIKMIFDGMEQPVVARYELKSSGKAYWDLSSLEPGHRYALAVYGSEDCNFIGEVGEHYYIKRWQSIHDRLVKNLGKTSKYVP
ncbi:MAG: hypothetical protein K2L07_07525 [Lachnospiraceae bacterium]|nr:hypothetical protein [Lachnospiraceae bacterium]